MKTLKSIFAFLILITASFSIANAQNMYMTIGSGAVGTVSSDANSIGSLGNLANLNHLDEITVLAIEYEMVYPVNYGTGMITGSLISQGLTVKKYIDRSSPLLALLLNNSNMMNIEINYFRNDPVGQEENYFRYSIEDARIVSIRPAVPDCIGCSAHYEEVTFIFDNIEIYHLIEGILHLINFQEP